LDSAVATARGASYFIIQSVITNLAQVVSFAILTRLITTKDMGILAVLSLILALAQIVGVPISQATTKFIAETSTVATTARSISVFYQSLRMNIVLVAPAAAAVFFGAHYLATSLLGQSSYTIFFQILAFDIIFYVGLNPILNGALLGVRKYKEIAAIGVGSTILRQALIISLIILLRSFLGLVVAWAFSDLATAVLYLAYALRLFLPPRSDFSQRQLLDYSWPLWISNAIGFGQSWFDRYLLIFYVSLSALGVYNATIIAFSVLQGIANAITTSLFPLYSSHGWTKFVRLSESVRLASRYASFIILPICWGLIATAEPALSLFLGNAYVSGTQSLIVLTATFAIGAFSLTAVSPVLLASGETLLSSIVSVISVIGSIALAFVLLPVEGIFGAAVARGVGSLLLAALTVIAVKRKNFLKLDVEAIWKSNVAAISMAAVLIFVQLFVHSKFLVPVYVVGGLGVYLTILRLLKAVHESDLELIRLYLGPKFSFASRLLNFLFPPNAP
jgi:O-antigen/teichoic acid export membrane protein